MLALNSMVTAAEYTAVVTDQAGNPIPNVTIATNLAGVRTMTDEDGTFSLVVRPGLTRITLSSVGYQPRQFEASDLPFEVVLLLQYIRGEDILVTDDRARLGITPIAFDNFSSDDIGRDYTVGELPFLLETTPNLYAYSDGGGGLGYSYMKIRGFDDKRVSTYINGVPLNDPEDHATYFVDLPDFAANVDDIQVQRGVGNSLYGDASFGGSINIVNSVFARESKTTLTSGYGEFTSDGKSISDIYKQSIEYSSGLIDGRWAFSGRFSKQKSGGYRRNSWYEGWSYYFALGRIDPRMTTELYVYGGPMRMHLAFYGADRDAIRLDRRANPYLTYDNDTDNFNQPHYHLHNAYKISDRSTLSNTIYYIRGKGYYEQFKGSRNYAEYNLLQFSDSSSGDLVRQKWVRKNQAGWNPKLVIDHDKGSHTFGGSFYYFESEHWGQVVRAEHLDMIPDRSLRYYEYFGKKYVSSIFAQEYYNFTERFSAQATAQIRHQRYDFDQSTMGAYNGLSYDLDFLSFSPRVGFNYKLNDRTGIYGSFAVASRTPTDGAIYDADNPFKLPSLEIRDFSVSAANDTIYTFGNPRVRNERVYDYEAGVNFTGERHRAGMNFFWMDFRDEILSYDIFGDLLYSINIDRSVHAGVEFSGTLSPARNLNLSGNFSYNYNRVKEFVRDLGGIDVDFKDSKIVGFPEYIGSFITDYHSQSWRFTYRLRLVGKQYMELANIESLAIGGYSLSSLTASHRLNIFNGTGDMTVLLSINNLFNRKYEAAGYGDNFAFLDGNNNVVVDGWAEYFVGAERSFWGQVKVNLF